MGTPILKKESEASRMKAISHIALVILLSWTLKNFLLMGGGQY
jgi:hypothetical protein